MAEQNVSVNIGHALSNTLVMLHAIGKICVTPALQCSSLNEGASHFSLKV